MPLAVSMSSYGCTREVRRALKKLVALGYVLSNSYASLVLSKLQAYIHNLIYFFPSLRAGGIFQILQSDWLRERAVFYDLAR